MKENIYLHKSKLKLYLNLFSTAENRTKFSMTRFLTVNKLGNPIAGNFFRAQYDSYVPTLYKHLGL